MTTSYQPWMKTATFPAWDIPLATDSVPENLTGVDITKFTMYFRNTAVAPPVDTQGKGTFSLKAIYPGEVYYQPDPADVASAFSGQLVIKAGFPPSNGVANQAVYDPLTFAISDD